MNDKSTKILKFILIILGALLMLISSKLNVATMDFSGNPLMPRAFHRSYTGMDVPFCSLVVIGGALLFLLSHFRNSLPFKIGYYFVLTIVIFLTAVFTRTFTTDTNDYVNTIEYGFYVLQVGFGLVVIGTLISLHRKVTNPTIGDKLLDVEF